MTGERYAVIGESEGYPVLYHRNQTPLIAEQLRKRREARITAMSAIFAVNNRRFDPLGERPVAGSAPARPAYTHESEGVTYTLEPSASGSYLMTAPRTKRRSRCSMWTTRRG